MKNGEEYPRVLVFGQGFNTHSGGGVTLINLFKGWPKDKLASIVTNYKHVSVNEVCENVFGLSRWNPFLSLISCKQYTAPSVQEVLNNRYVFEANINKTNRSPLPKSLKIVEKLGILPLLHNNKVPEALIRWIKEFNPDIIYTQLADLNVAIMVYDLSIILRVPIALHIMDDWPRTIYTKGIFSIIFRWRMEKYFQRLINKSTILMGISEAMCIEYQKRYIREFVSFHNPIEINKWLNYQKNDWRLYDKVTILYMGRFGLVTKESLNDLVDVISGLNVEGNNINLKIVTPDFNEQLKKQIEVDHNIELLPSVANDKVPELLIGADILFLPLDFGNEAIDFIRYSMPTKSTEYMISGVPILIYAPNNVALTNYAHDKKWAIVVDVRSKNQLKQAIIDLMKDEKLRKSLGQRAIELSIKKHDATIVREEFRKTLFNGTN